MSRPGKLRPTRFAHEEGITDICYSDNGKYIVTCGIDGDVRLFEGLDDDDCKSLTVAQKAHCIAYQNGDSLLVGTDLNMIQSFTIDEGQKSGIITRFTSHPTSIQISKNKNIIAAGSTDMTVKVHDVAAGEDFIFKGHEAPVLSVTIDPKGDVIASSSCDGTVKVWNVRTQTVVRSFSILPKSNNYSNSVTSCRLTFTPDGKYLIVPVEKHLQFYNRGNWKVEFNLEDTSITSVISVACVSACGDYVACGCRDGQIIIWNLNSKCIIANDKPMGGRSVTGLVFNPSGIDTIAYVNANGELGTMEKYLQADLQLPPSKKPNSDSSTVDAMDETRPSSTNSHVPMDDIEDDSEFSLSKIKSQFGFADDADGTFLGLPSTEVDESESRPESRLTSVMASERITQPSFPQPQKPFQPGMSPEHLTDRYMLWNRTGIVRQYRNEDNNSIEVEFHNCQIHHSLHFSTLPDQVAFTIAALNEQALVLAAESQDDQLSKLEVHHFSAWDGSKEWMIHFPEGEDIVAVSIGEGWIAAATDKRNLRLFSTSGVQLSVHCLPGPVVSLAGMNDQLMIVYHSGIGVLGQPNLSSVIVSAKTGGRHQMGAPVPLPLSPNAYLSWVGFTDEGNPVSMDSAGIVRLYTRTVGSLWTVVLNSKNYAKGKSDHYFLISVSELQGLVRCIFCKGCRYPPVVPKPHVNLLEFKIPLCEPEEEKSILEESLIEAKLLSQTAHRFTHHPNIEETLVEINKKLKESMIKLFALACRSDRESRAIDVCESMSSPELIELAIKYSSKTHRMQLAERLSVIAEAKMEEKIALEQQESFNQSQVSVEEENGSSRRDLIENGDATITSNPFLNVLARRNSNADPTPTPSPGTMNPFRKTPANQSRSSKGIKVLDTLQAPKTKQAPIMRPVMRKPKSKQSDNMDKSVRAAVADVVNSDGATKENNEWLANKSDIVGNKTSALKLWFDDNKALVANQFPETPDAIIMVKAAGLFKDVEESIKKKYKSVASQINREMDDKKRASESKAQGEPAEKKVKSAAVSKLAGFAFTPKES